MGFTTHTFLFVFLPCSIIVYLISCLSKKIIVQNLVLIVLNLVFYAWSSLNSLAVFVICTVVTYVFGNLIFYIRKDVEVEKKRLIHWTIFAIIIILLPLLLSKYHFLVKIITNLVAQNTKNINSIVVPIGISFLTFECISYLLDIKHGDSTPGSFFDLLLFLSLFPKLLSGPIVQWKYFQNQISKRKSDIVLGFEKIIIGYAEKVIIADTLGAQIKLINGQKFIDCGTVWLKSLIYFFEIYYDFLGYSMIAIGLCCIFGFEIKDNFNYPYVSKSITEFWRRWHISLGSWFREYVYIPLGGNKRGCVSLNLLIVFLLTGIWHGANWTFVIWGLLHGVAVVLERAASKTLWYNKIPNWIKQIVTIFYVFLLWVLFYSDNLKSALDIFKQMFCFSNCEMLVNFTWQFFLTKKIMIILLVAAIGSFSSFFSKYKSWILTKFNGGGMQCITHRLWHCLSLISCL